MMVQSNLAQALQHFVSNSPWDQLRLLAKLRELTRSARQDHAACWVIHDSVFAKKGRHSVGVHRQYARAQGRKVNCQIGVILAQSGPKGYFPLAIRLYLPASWLRDASEATLRLLPEDERKSHTRAQLAMTLIDELLATGESVRPIALESGFATADLLEELTKKGLNIAQDNDARLASTLEQFEVVKEQFGLDHFEGRNWIGWHHHAALVFTASHFAKTIS